MKYIILLVIPVGFIPIVEYIFNIPGNLFGACSFALAITISLGLVVLVADSVFKFSIPDNYYQLRAFEKSGDLYKTLGIRTAKIIFKRSQNITFSGRRSDISKLQNETMIAEKHHILAFLGVTFLVIYSLIKTEWVFAIGLILFNLLLHAYPVMLQRYNRSRILEIKHNKRLKHAR